MSKNKEKLIILSDIFGKEKSDWISLYFKYLESKFDITYYDSQTLGEVTLNTKNQESIHSKFINFGINKAVKNLVNSETESINILAFSIGGTIAWKAALIGLNVNRFWGISSTRLRYETEKPNCKTTLFYGENDSYKPDANWFQKLNINHHILENKDHDIYSKPETITFICNTILKTCD